MHEINFTQVLGDAQSHIKDAKSISTELTSEEGMVSFQTELPEPLQQAMNGFIEKYPNWDQYRLFQAALAGFLVQNGVESRPVTRLYVTNMFRSESLDQCI